MTHPLFGFFGTRNGQMMPTMPQKTLKMMIGMAEAPIARKEETEAAPRSTNPGSRTRMKRLLCCHLLRDPADDQGTYG